MTTWSNITDNGLLYSNISGSETSIGTTNSMLSDGFSPAATTDSFGIPVSGLTWRGFVAGASGGGGTASSLKVELSYDISSVDPTQGISAVRLHNFTPDFASGATFPPGARFVVRQEVYDSTGTTLLAQSTLRLDASTNDRADDAVNAEPTDQLALAGGAQSAVKVKIIVEVEIDADAAAGTTLSFSALRQNYNADDAVAGLGDFVWLDDGDGVQENGEAGVGGVVVELLDSNGDVVDDTTTNPDGSYSFTGLVPGTYSVRFTPPEGYGFTQANQGGDDATDSDAVGGVTQQVTLVGGTFNGTLDAGLVKLDRSVDIEKFVSVDGGVTWYDADDDTGFEALEGIGPNLLEATVDPIFKFVVTNTGQVTLTNLEVSDSDFDLNGGDPGTSVIIASLAAGASVTLPLLTADWVADQHKNTATVTVTYTDGLGADEILSDSDDAHYFGEIDTSLGAVPQINVVKTTSGNATAMGDDGVVILAGADVYWNYVVTNAGTVPISNVALVDDAGTPDDDGDDFNPTAVLGLNGFNIGDLNEDDILDLTEAWVFKHNGGDAIRGEYENVVTATGDYTDRLGETTFASDDDPSSYLGVLPDVDIEKLVSVDGGLTWVDADTTVGQPLLANGATPMFRFQVTNTGDVTLTNLVVSDDKLDLNGATTGTTVTIASLGAGLSTFFDIAGTWQAGQHTNVATVTSTWTDSFGNSATVDDSDAANYFGQTPPPITGPGVGTPGFWGRWTDLWDGDASAPRQAGNPGFAAGDVLWLTYGAMGGPVDPVTGNNTMGLLIGDYNKNGQTDANEETIFYTVSEALALINASNQTLNQDARAILDRQLVATWLNFLAGNPLEAADPTKTDARDAVDAAIDWLQLYTPNEGGVDSQGDGMLTAATRMRSNAAPWNSSVAGLPAGGTIKDWLDEYNNNGTVLGTQIAFDRDSFG